MTEAGQQKDYALAQFSQSEEARQNKDTEGKYAVDMANVQQIMADIPADQQAAVLDDMKVQIDQEKADQDGAHIGVEGENIQADTDLKSANALVALRPEPING